VSSAGDFNHDGIKDVIIGAAQADPLGKLNAGIVYVIFGHNTQSSMFADIDLQTMVSGPGVGFRIYGSVAGYGAGTSVTGGGDINGDGIDDIIFSMPLATASGRATTGTSIVIYGHNSDYLYTDLDVGNTANPTSPTAKFFSTSTLIGFRIQGRLSGDQSGWSVKIVPDINGDNISDILVGSAQATSTKGVVNIIFGRNRLTSNFTGNVDFSGTNYPSSVTNGFTVVGASSGNQIGKQLSGAGDVNGDGINDFIVGVPLATSNSNTNAGVVYVIFGRSAIDYICRALI